MLQIAVGVVLGQCERVLSGLAGAVDDFVVDIGEIGHVGDLVSQVLEVAPNHVEDNCAHCVADVGIGIDRGSADIHAHTPLLQRLERLDFAAEGIEYAQCHGQSFALWLRMVARLPVAAEPSKW